MKQFIFGGDTDLTHEQIKRQRAIADQLAKSTTATPKNVGEGLHAIGKALAARRIGKRTGEADKKNQDAFNSEWAGVSDMQMPSYSGGQYTPESYSAGAYTPGSYSQGGASSGNVRNSAMAAGGGPTNAAGVIEGLVQRGMPPHIAEAFAINFKDESGLNPGINEISPLVPGSRGGFGLAQWTGPRRKQLEAFAAQRGRPVSDMDTQLDFLMTELQGSESRAAKSIFSAQDTPQAAAAILNKFLRPAESHRARREARYLSGQSGVQYTPGQHQQGSYTPFAYQRGQHQAASMDDVEKLATIAGNPYASDAQKAVAQQMLQQMLGSQDPMRSMELNRADLDLSRDSAPDAMRQMELERQGMQNAQMGNPEADPMKGMAVERAQLELDAMRNPQPKQTDDMREYEAAKAQGYDGTFMDYMTAIRRSGSTKINMGTGQPRMGTIPQGFEVVTDPQTGQNTMRRIPGGPEDTSRQDAARAGAKQTTGDVVMSAATRALEASKARILDGVLGRAASLNPESQNAEVYRQVDVLRGNATIESLNAMRQQSPTGGALGNVTEKEGAMLAARAGALDPASPNFERDLEDYTRTLFEVVHGRDDGAKMFREQWGAPEMSEAKEGGIPSSFIDAIGPLEGGVTPEMIWQNIDPAMRQRYLER